MLLTIVGLALEGVAVLILIAFATGNATELLRLLRSVKLRATTGAATSTRGRATADAPEPEDLEERVRRIEVRLDGLERQLGDLRQALDDRIRELRDELMKELRGVRSEVADATRAQQERELGSHRVAALAAAFLLAGIVPQILAATCI
jgi:hypothetical protein